MGVQLSVRVVLDRHTKPDMSYWPSLVQYPEILSRVTVNPPSMLIDIVPDSIRERMVFFFFLSMALLTFAIIPIEWVQMLAATLSVVTWILALPSVLEKRKRFNWAVAAQNEYISAVTSPTAIAIEEVQIPLLRDLNGRYFVNWLDGVWWVGDTDDDVALARLIL